MGYMRHHAIVVTSSNDESIQLAQAKAFEFFPPELVTAITDSGMNGYRTFFVAPDGSKEGWDTSQFGDDARAKLVEWLRAAEFCDGSSSYDWVVVQYGDDNGVQKIVEASR